MVAKDPEITAAEMDETAEVAEAELDNLDAEAVKLIGGWMKRHYKTAGYKRLSKKLIAKGG